MDTVSGMCSSEDQTEALGSLELPDLAGDPLSQPRIVDLVDQILDLGPSTVTPSPSSIDVRRG